MVPACKQWVGVCAPIHCPLPLACLMADDQRLFDVAARKEKEQS